MANPIIATYRLSPEPKEDLKKKAESIALGQTVGAWTPLPGTDPNHWEKHRGEVVATRSLDRASEVQVAFPTANCEPDIASLLTMVFGKVSLDGKIKLIDLELPAEWINQFPGPKFGVSGIRGRLNIKDRPLTMAIFKPCVGLSPEQLGEMFQGLIEGGLDLVKDDEILPDLPTAPTQDRLKTCLAAANELKQKTGRNVLYAVNLTGPASTLLERAEELQALGANCFLLNALSYGWATLEALARSPKIQTPIMAHPALSGALCSAPEYGFGYPLILGKLMRLAGADFVLYPSHYGRFPFPKEDEFGIRDALTQSWKESKLKPTWPVPSVGIHPGMVPRLLADYGNDVVINAGGGIHGHPQGPQAGARAMIQAVALTLSGQSFTESLPPKHEELTAAIKVWGT